jgi:hypothetical protein
MEHPMVTTSTSDVYEVVHVVRLRGPTKATGEEGLMSTVHTPPIDLYAETDDPEERWANATPRDIETSPRENGDRDEPAVQAGERRLQQVLGW